MRRPEATRLFGARQVQPETKHMRLIDETNGIKHSSALMQPPIPSLLAALLLGAALNTQAQTPAAPTLNNAPTNAAAPTAVVGTAPSGMAATNSPARQTRVLSLADAIQLALRHNFDIQIQQFNPVIDQFSLNSTYGAYEPVFSISAQKNYDAVPGGINPQTHLPFQGNLYESDSWSPGIQGLLPTGLSYDLTGPLSRQSQGVFPQNSPFYWAPPNWQANPGITLDQPLLKNFWIDNTRLQIRLNKATLKMSVEQLRQQIMASVTAVKSGYYNLLYARGNVDANATALQLANQLVAENLKRVEVGALAPLDEKQSESQAAASQAALQVARQALVVQENTFKSLLTDNYTEWANVTPIPSEELVAVPETLNLQESWRRAVTQRPELIEAKLNVEKQNVTLKYQFNQLFPQLDLTGSYGRNSFNATFNSALGDIQSGANSFYSYGAILTIPLGGNISARNTYKSGKASLKQILLQLKQLEQNILVAVDNDVGQVRSTLQQVDATRAARVYAEDALAAEKKKLENGKSTSFIVLQLISTLTTARVSELQALANYNIAVVQLSLDEGSTLEDNHIELKGR